MTDSTKLLPRDDTIDTLRGFAIAMMVFGHLAIEVIVPPGGFYIEALGGSAPVVFLLVVGMMAAYGVRFRGYGLRHSLARGGMVLALGVVLDLAIWRIVPFTTVDVLYLIALAVPAAALVARLPAPVALALAVVVFAATPPLQGLLGYTDWPTEIPFSGGAPESIRLEGVGAVQVQNPTSILNHWLIDGWFPVFPWLGVAWLGVAIAAVRWPEAGPRPRRFSWTTGLLPAVALLAVAFALGWWDVEYELTLRRRWGGAFMPPGYDYLLGSVGLFLLVGWLVDRAPHARIWAPLRAVGREALLVYLAHFVLLRLVAKALPGRIEHPLFWVVYVLVMAALLGLVALKRRIVRPRGTG